MKRFHLLTASFAAILLVGSISNSQLMADDESSASDRDKKLISSFIEHVDSLEIVSSTDKQKAKSILVGKPAAAITDALVALYPDFAKGISFAEQGEINPGVDLLTPLSVSDDSFLAADASFYLSRMLMNGEQFEQAIPLLERLTGELTNYSIHSGETLYFLGVAQAGMLNREAAISSFTLFLKSFPGAAERLRVSAWRQIQQLQSIQDGQLNDVQRHMDFSRRRLDQQDTGEQTQEKQDRIVNMLAKLIKEEEKKECNSSCKNSGKNKPKDSENAQAPKQSEEPKPGQAQEGGSSSNPNGEAVQKTYDDSPASPWSRLRDRSRDPANNAIKEKLPARYRDIVEKYYEAANGNPSDPTKKNK